MSDVKFLGFEGRTTRIRLRKAFFSFIFAFVVLIISNITVGNSALYSYNGETFEKQSFDTYSRGRIVEFTNKDDFCHSPILIPGTSLRPTWLLVIVYFIALLYLFLGIAIGSDKLMYSIEMITSQRRKVNFRDVDGIEQSATVAFWNPTIANLTLMAIGSAAPEILISIIETCIKLGDEPGDIGTGTIVGSAAFNLFVVTALSMVCIPTWTVK